MRALAWGHLAAKEAEGAPGSKNYYAAAASASSCTTTVAATATCGAAFAAAAFAATCTATCTANVRLVVVRWPRGSLADKVHLCQVPRLCRVHHIAAAFISA